MLLYHEPRDGPRVRELICPILASYPVCLFVDDLGPLVANDAYAAPKVWEIFRRDAYHSPTVVWGRDVNVLLAGLAQQRSSGGVGGPAAAAPPPTPPRRGSEAAERSRPPPAPPWGCSIPSDSTQK